jgi:hypothetical protein
MRGKSTFMGYGVGRRGVANVLEKGKGIPTGMDRAAMQYGILDKLFGGLTFDLTKNAWRRGGWLDAIVTDPPCELALFLEFM